MFVLRNLISHSCCEVSLDNNMADIHCCRSRYLHDSLHLHTIYNAAENIPRAQFAWALLEVFFFLAVFAEFVLAKDFRLCEKQ